MLDKLVLTPSASNEALFDCRLNITDVRRIAAENGLTIMGARSRSRERGSFYGVAGYPAIIFKAWANGDIQRIDTNPARFDTWSEYDAVMNRLSSTENGTIAVEGWLQDAIVQRTDLAVRYFTPFDDMVRGLDVELRRGSIQFHRRSGGTNSMYAGRSNDQYCMYNESEFLLGDRRGERGRADLRRRAENGEHFTKLERQISGPANVANTANPALRSARRLQYSDVPAHLRTIVDGTISPLRSVQLGNIRLRDFDTMTRAEVVRAARLEGALDFTPYSDVRRRYNAGGNFARLYETLIDYELYPDDRQPPAMLRQSLATFIQWRPIRPRQPSRFATVAETGVAA